MKHSWTKRILIFSLIFTALWGIFVLIYGHMIVFNAVNFVFSVIFLASMIITSILSVQTDKTNIKIKIFLCYWILVFFSYHISDFTDINVLEKISEFMIAPFGSLFSILWEFTDGETATVIGLISAYYVMPVLMIIYFAVILFRWDNIAKCCIDAD